MTRRGRPAAAGPGGSRGRLEAVRRVYDGWAGLYDWNPVLPLVRPARRAAVEALELSPGDTAVDMGTGTGLNLAILRRAVGPDGTVVGVDLSPRMLARARRRVDRRGWDNVALVRGDVREPPVAGPVDGVLSSFAVLIFDRPDEVVRAWAALVDDGTVANLYAGPSARRYGPVVNALLGGYCRLFEAGWNRGSTDDGPLDLLAERGERARRALAACATSVRTDDRLFGLLHLDVGSFTGDAARSGAAERE